MSVPQRNSSQTIIRSAAARDSTSLPDLGGDWKQIYTNKLRAALANLNPKLFGRQSYYDDEKGPGADR